MNNNNSVGFRRQGSLERSNTLPSPSGQRSASTARWSSWNIFRNHSINSSTNRAANRLRSSSESTRPFLGLQSTAPAYSPGTELPSISSNPTPSSSASQRTPASPSATLQIPNQSAVGNDSPTP